MSRRRRVNCPGCGQTKPLVRGTVEVNTPGQGDAFTVVQCRECWLSLRAMVEGLSLFAQPRLIADRIWLVASG